MLLRVEFHRLPNAGNSELDGFGFTQTKISYKPSVSMTYHIA